MCPVVLEEDPVPLFAHAAFECMQLLVQPLVRKLEFLKFISPARHLKGFQFLEERCAGGMHQGTWLFGIVLNIYLNLHLARCAARPRDKAGVGVVIRLVLGGGQHGS